MKGKKNQFIMIQLPEDIDRKYNKSTGDSKKNAKKLIDFLDSVNRPHYLDQIGIERIIRVAQKIKEENPNTIVDFGFKHYILKETNKNTLDKIESFDKLGLIEDTTIYNQYGVNTILITWLVRDGYGLVIIVRL